MTRIDPDDPKWSAYVLNELTDNERAALEFELESSEEARMLVEELRFAAEFTKAELREGLSVAPLTQQERALIYASANIVKPGRWFAGRPAMWAAGLAAASIALMAALTPLLMRSPKAPPLPLPAIARVEQVPKDVQKMEEPAAPVVVTDRPKPAQEFEFRYEHPAQPAQAQPAIETEQESATGSVFGTVKDEAAALIPGVSQLGGTSQSVEATVSADSLRTSPAASVGQVRSETQIREPFRSVAPGVGGGGAPGFGAGVGAPAQIGQQAFLEAAATEAPGVPFPPIDRRSPGFYRGGESYDTINDNAFLDAGQNPLSTFSIDVDTASYSNLRRFINQNQRPPRDAVRVEEMINYFTYEYPQPAGNNPIGATLETAAAPWNPQHRLVRIGLKAREIDARRRPASNFVFLLDVSGSMQPQERLPLLKDGIRMFVEQLTGNDRVTVVTYAGTTGVALRPTRGDQKDVILGLIDSLQAGGSTNGASGIQLAYDQAAANFIPGGVNRVILATDGDFNVGITDRNALLRLIEDKAKSGVFLSVLGVGMGNYKDATLEMLADKGNGNFAYLDTLNEARKVLVDQMNATLITVAKDVKIQVEFNPAVAGAYRLIGYENRALRNEDFNNDLKDAGEMGAGHTVTVLYEVVPRGVAIGVPGVDPLKYQPPAAPPARDPSNETLTVKIRYKEPSGSDSKVLSFPLVDREQAFARATPDFRFAAAVASFGMILRNSPYKGSVTVDSVLGIAEDSMSSDKSGYRREFVDLLRRAKGLGYGR